MCLIVFRKYNEEGFIRWVRPSAHLPFPAFTCTHLEGKRGDVTKIRILLSLYISPSVMYESLFYSLCQWNKYFFFTLIYICLYPMAKVQCFSLSFYFVRLAACRCFGTLSYGTPWRWIRNKRSGKNDARHNVRRGITLLLIWGHNGVISNAVNLYLLSASMQIFFPFTHTHFYVELTVSLHLNATKSDITLLYYNIMI